MKYQAVLFDFDGTIIDSSHGVVECAQEAMRAMGRTISDEEIYSAFIGPPLMHSFMTLGKMTEEEATQAVAIYREKYQEIGIENGRIYDGIIPLLDELKKRGVLLGIASVKLETIVKETVKYFGIEHYFQAICGGWQGVVDLPKEIVIEKAMKELNAKPSETFMIGDTWLDEDGAYNANVDFCAALWGFGFQNGEDLSRAKYIAQNVEQLRRILVAELI